MKQAMRKTPPYRTENAGNHRSTGPVPTRYTLKLIADPPGRDALDRTPTERLRGVVNLIHKGGLGFRCTFAPDATDGADDGNYLIPTEHEDTDE